MAGSDVKLVGIRPCPYVNRAQIALNLKSVEHEFIEVNPYTDRDMLVKLNPVHKKIPVLIHEEKSVCESLIVVQYIDEVWTNGTSILPYDPYDRAIALFWASYIEEKVSISSLHYFIHLTRMFRTDHLIKKAVSCSLIML